MHRVRWIFMLATPAKWKVFKVIWVPGSPMLWAPTAPTAVPGSIRARMNLSTQVVKNFSSWVLVILWTWYRTECSHQTSRGNRRGILVTCYIVYIVQITCAVSNGTQPLGTVSSIGLSSSPISALLSAPLDGYKQAGKHCIKERDTWARQSILLFKWISYSMLQPKWL